MALMVEQHAFDRMLPGGEGRQQGFGLAERHARVAPSMADQQWCAELIDQGQRRDLFQKLTVFDRVAVLDRPMAPAPGAGIAQ